MIIKEVSKDWSLLNKVGAVAALIIVGFMPLQMVVFFVWPPPTTVSGWFGLFSENAIVGLLDMDLLLILDYVLLVLVFLALWGVLRRGNEPLVTVALIFQIVGTAAYFSSATAFEMLSLSSQYATVTTDSERSILLSAGQAMLASWQGTAFNVSYVIGAIAALIMSLVMLKNRQLFGRFAAHTGIVAGVLGLVPSTAGQVGLVFSLISLPPLTIWLVLVGKGLLKQARIIDHDEAR
jgi:hypothetical protein